jgi:hypothetical protein
MPMAKHVNPHQIVGKHPYLDVQVDLKWYRGASRYNNGATLYRRKYIFRFLISRRKNAIQYDLVPTGI